MIIDMHVHSKASLDSRFVCKYKSRYQLNGLVLTEHRFYDTDTDYANHHWFLTCATEFENPVYSDDDLAKELESGNFRPVRLKQQR
ncbi:MAG: hypothetical protein R6U50_12440 [Desulfobacterales bacterium]